MRMVRRPRAMPTPPGTPLVNIPLSTVSPQPDMVTFAYFAALFIVGLSLYSFVTTLAIQGIRSAWTAFTRGDMTLPPIFQGKTFWRAVAYTACTGIALSVIVTAISVVVLNSDHPLSSSITAGILVSLACMLAIAGVTTAVGMFLITLALLLFPFLVTFHREEPSHTLETKKVDRD